MRSVRQRDTAPELQLRRMLHAQGWRYRLHRKELPGKPDIVFPSRQKAIFVHGCFWHAHDCALGRAPKTRTEFWSQKRRQNQERDERAINNLTKLGWTSLIVWQCELKHPASAMQKVTEFLNTVKGENLRASGECLKKETRGE